MRSRRAIRASASGVVEKLKNVPMIQGMRGHILRNRGGKKYGNSSTNHIYVLPFPCPCLPV
ncbi:hypothetical protein BRADI_5g21381v3 [Brachypodium distachyon]|uniref:Uncharacterized protein n=1 Tax=Brachypodium distachyon TaxID=15368 RepID=A0A2K2CIG0_BRADI|nr:hypothetical protein BRADI_5g21381v3 [Brachypodium distachyon]